MTVSIDEVIAQLYAEYKLREDGDAESEHAQAVALETAQRRASLLGRDPRIEDGIFAFWAWCWPMFPQNPRYTSFMKAVRRGLLHRESEASARENARRFLTDEFLQLGLDELSVVVTRPGILDEWRLGRQVKVFDVSMLPREIWPACRGMVCLDI